MSLLEEQVRSFRKDGYLSPIRVADDEETAHYRGRFDALEAEVGRENATIGLLDRHHDQPFIWELAMNPVIVNAVKSILGPDALLLATHFFCKYGGGEKFVAWHQDVTYWGLEPPTAITAWYAVDDSDVANGCMRVIPGTHRDGIRTHGRAATAGNLLASNQEVPVTSDEEVTAVDLVLKAGEMSLHDGALIHGSLPNRSNRRRCGLTLRYIPGNVKFVATPNTGREWRPTPLP
jgi:ectoine hydroxylase-related dioxygenase (phytanoyl-CoA dioxygenase family)